MSRSRRRLDHIELLNLLFVLCAKHQEMARKQVAQQKLKIINEGLEVAEERVVRFKDNDN
ncbi:unnamed protein product [Lupinus luteus]|uniref:Uncharacterized protein n=1 Tax=Lupinus luteus TaxID=3873 RepID=A0AAV1XW79_LUPLU